MDARAIDTDRLVDGALRSTLDELMDRTMLWAREIITFQPRRLNQPDFDGDSASPTRGLCKHACRPAVNLLVLLLSARRGAPQRIDRLDRSHRIRLPGMGIHPSE